jgi:hypothetical protein
MYIEPSTQPQPIKVSPSLQVALGVAVLLVMLIGLFPQRIMDLTQKAASSSGLKVGGAEAPAAGPQARPAKAPR